MSRRHTVQLVLLVLCACSSPGPVAGVGEEIPPPASPADPGPAAPTSPGDPPAGDETTAPPPPEVTGVCDGCHGSAENAAPPSSVSGASQTADRGVGAHQRHLVGLVTRKPLACAECHLVPSVVSAPGHMDGAVSVVFDAPGSSGVARAGGAQPAWNRDTATCASVYCHGATLAGAVTTDLVWTRVDGSQVWCGGCHGVPPPRSSGHPASFACARCHDSIRDDGTFDFEKHIDGIVQLAAGSCTVCHGDPARQPASIAPAPPVDARGSASSDAIGAHMAHLTGSAISAGVPCDSCHVVPTDGAHVDGVTALEWGPLPRSRAAQPTWDPAQRTCTNYCHGATMAGGGLTTPAWSGGPSQATCGSCHGLPPTSRHPDVGGGVSECAGCHPATARPDGSIDSAGGRHVNGVVDVDFTVRGCSSCHGGTLSGTDAAGVDLAPAPGSGAHVRHLTGGMARLRCSDCHGAVPTSMTHADGTVQLPFGGIAAGTQWNGSTCSTSYCHGAIGSGGANGGSGAVVSWEAMGEPLGCTACHHGGHYESHLGGACSSCHNHVNASGTAIIQPTLHVNGRRNMANCNSGCHNF